MSIIYAGNFAELMGSASFHTTTGVDTTFTDAGVVLALPGELGVSCDLGAASSAGELWLHARFNATLAANTAASYHVFRVFAGATEFRVEKNATSAFLVARVDNAGNTNGVQWAFVGGVTYTLDMRCRFSGGNAITEFYVNGALVSSASRAAIPQPFELGGWGNGMGVRSASGANTVYVSEFIAATEDTRGRRVATLVGNVGAGAYSEWVGASADLIDFNSLTGVTAGVADLRESRVHEAAVAGTVRAVIVQNRYLVSPSDARLAQFVRIAGSDYTGAIKSPGIAAPANVVATVFEVNPATGVAWTTGDLAALEAGFTSKSP